MTCTRSIIIENSACVILARVTKDTGANVVQADVSAVAVKVFDTETEAQVGATLTPAVSSCFYDTLQIDSRWPIDTTGYNFALSVNGSYFPDGGKVYQVEVRVTPTSGDPFYMEPWQLQTRNIYSE